LILNAGGRAFDAIRSLAVLQTIGQPGTIVVMHHTGMFVYWYKGLRVELMRLDCGMTHFHDDTVRKALVELAPQEKESIEASKFGEITTSLVSPV
jgi:carbonic anhydrase